MCVAKNRISVLLNRLAEAKNDSAKVWIYSELADYYIQSKIDSSVYYSKKGLVLSQRSNYLFGEYWMIGKLANISHFHGNYYLAKNYAYEALKGFQKLGKGKNVSQVYNTLGVIEAKNGNFPAATDYFLKALKLSEEINDDSGVVQAYIKLGSVNEKIGNLSKALNYYTKARKLNEKRPKIEQTISIINNVGIVYAKMGDIKKALDHFLDGIHKSEGAEFFGLHVSLLTNAGNAYQNLGFLDTSKVYHERSLLKAREYNLPEEEARALINLSNVYNEKGQFKKAHELLSKSLTIATAIGQKQVIIEIYDCMMDVYEQQSDFRNAFLISQKRAELYETLFGIDKKREMELLQSKYEQDKSNSHIRTLELLNSKRTLQRNTGIGVALVVILILFLMFFSLFKMKKLNKELRTSNMVKDKLFSIIGHDLRGPIGTVVQMLSLIVNDDLNPGEYKEIVKTLKKHTEVSLSTLDSLLEWGRTQMQGIIVNRTTFVVGEVIKKNLAIFNASSQVKSISIVNNIPDDLEVYADIDHFDFVLRNLLSNAIKFTYMGGIIELKIEERDGHTCFCIKDNGKGMEEEECDQLFRTFTLKKEGTLGELGTGIGLMLCKEFVMANDGHIWAESKVNEGTTFYFTFRH